MLNLSQCYTSGNYCIHPGTTVYMVGAKLQTKTELLGTSTEQLTAQQYKAAEGLLEEYECLPSKSTNIIKHNAQFQLTRLISVRRWFVLDRVRNHSVI